MTKAAFRLSLLLMVAIGIGVAICIVDAFVGGTFEGGRHGRRVDKITALEGG